MVSKNSIRFVVLLLVQVLLINNITFGAYIYPALYIYFILLLPVETAGWLLLSSSFLLGLGVDFFSNSLGLNAGASVFVAFLRPAVFRILKTKKEYVQGMTPSIRNMGFSWFFFYALIMILAHHSVLFFLEAFSLKNLDQTLMRILYSSGFLLLLVLMLQLLFSRQDKR